MTNKEASERIQKHRDMINNTFPNSLMAIENTEALDMAIKAIEQQDKERWIPVSERLPKEREEVRDIYEVESLALIDSDNYLISDLVLLTVKDNEKDELFVSDDVTVNGKWANFEGSGYEVIAWKPMPEPFIELDLVDKIREELSSWPQWKKDAYNEMFVSKHSTKLE